MSELSYVLELYFANEDDEVAVENVQTGLTVSRFEGRSVSKLAERGEMTG